MTARFTRSVARGDIAIGIAIIVLGVASAGAIALGWPEDFARDLPPRNAMAMRAGAATIALLAGLVMGTPFIVVGQLVLVFLDIRRRLARLDRRSARWIARDAGQESPATKRLVPR
jgi:hypothetical protein